MNQITLHGNLTANPVTNTSQSTGRSVVTFDIAINSGYYERATNQWRDRAPVFHRVVCFGDLAENVASSLRKGVTVTVTGTLADNSYTPNGAERPLRRTQLEAADVAVSLRHTVVAVPPRQSRPTEPWTQPEQPATDEAPAPDADEQAPSPAAAERRTRRTRTEPAAA